MLVSLPKAPPELLQTPPTIDAPTHEEPITECGSHYIQTVYLLTQKACFQQTQLLASPYQENDVIYCQCINN